MYWVCDSRVVGCRPGRIAVPTHPLAPTHQIGHRYMEIPTLMPALGQLWTGPTEPPPARDIPATAPFEDHTLAAHHDFSYPVMCDLHTDDQPERQSAELLSIFVDVFAEGLTTDARGRVHDAPALRDLAEEGHRWHAWRQAVRRVVAAHWLE